MLPYDPLGVLPTNILKIPYSQESPRQTKPKKGQFMNFSRGQTGTKVRCESACFPKEKIPDFTKMGEIHDLFVLALSLVWCRGDSWYREEKKRTLPPPEENLLESFSGLKEKQSTPVVDTKTLFFKTKENHIYHQNLSSVAPNFFFFGKESLAAQCEIPLHIAQYPFEIVSQRGVSHPFALFS